MYYPSIGLEIHIELKTKSKLFCSCPNDPEERTSNSSICPICLGHPGVLPAINEEAIKKVIKTGLALTCEIAKQSRFDRKNYFYPDLPKGYQISQLYLPLCKNGSLGMFKRKIRIREIHLEEDTARLLHPPKEKYSLVDFNRSGIPLMELVTEPDIKNGEEARKFAEELKLILRYLNISEADMEKGQMRIEANVSISEEKDKLGTRVEIKNINSFRAVERAIDYEIKRQGEILEKGEKVSQETFGWDDEKGKTIPQREKEMAFDYRYFPEPDLPVLSFEEEFIETIRAEVSETPPQRRKRFSREYSLSTGEAEIFVQNKDLGEYFEKTISELPPRLSEKELSGLTKLVSNYLTTDLLGLLREASIVDGGFLIQPKDFAQLILMIFKGEISSKIGKTVLQEMFLTGFSPVRIIEEKGLEMVADESEIGKVVKEMIEKNSKAVEDFQRGKENALQFLLGQIMKLTKGKVDPRIARKVLLKFLAKK